MADVKPDEKVFRSHVERGPFRSGEDRGRWCLVSIEWPYAVICVAAAARVGGTEEYAFRFELTDYPQAPPTAQLWDLGSGAPLTITRWPTGSYRVPRAFNPNWNPSAIYIPCDRQAILGHDPWRTQHPEMIWSSSSDITLYLRILHELLNSSDYTGPVSS